MTEVLVTGGTGFVGSNLVKRLVDCGYAVRVFDNNWRGSLDRLGDYGNQIDFIERDIRNSQAVDDAVSGVTWLFHLACINGTRYFYEMPDRVLEVGVKGALNTLEASLKHEVKRYILISSSEVYQEPTHIPTSEDERVIIPDVRNPRFSYSGAKIISELLVFNYLREADIDAIIVRPHNIYGPNMGFEHVIPEFIVKMLELSDNLTKTKINFQIQGCGRETRAFCYIDDAIDGLVICAEKGSDGQVYHLGTEEEVSIASLAHKVANNLGIQVYTKAGDLRRGSTSRRCPDTSKLRSIGYNPKVTLDEGLRKTCDWYVEYWRRERK